MYSKTLSPIISVSGFPEEINDEINQPDIKMLFDETMKVKNFLSVQFHNSFFQMYWSEDILFGEVYLIKIETLIFMNHKAYLKK